MERVVYVLEKWNRKGIIAAEFHRWKQQDARRMIDVAKITSSVLFGDVMVRNGIFWTIWEQT